MEISGLSKGNAKHLPSFRLNAEGQPHFGGWLPHVQKRVDQLLEIGNFLIPPEK